MEVTREKNVKKIFSENHDMSTKPKNYLKDKAIQEKLDFERNRPMKIQLQTWKRFQLKVLVVTTFIPFLITYFVLYFPIKHSDIDTSNFHKILFVISMASPLIMLLVYAVIFIIFTVLLYRLFFGLRETLYFFNMINPYKMLFFFILTEIYLSIQVWLMWELA